MAGLLTSNIQSYVPQAGEEELVRQALAAPTGSASLAELAKGKENIVIWSVAGGALFNFLINFALIPLLAQDGAAIATFAAELVVLIIQITWGRRFIPFPIIERVHLHYVTAGILMAIALWAVGGCMPNVWMQLLLSIATGSIVYVGALAFMHDALLREMGQYALGLVKRKKKP